MSSKMLHHLIDWLWSLQLLEDWKLTPNKFAKISDKVLDLLDETTLSDEISEEEYAALEDAIRDAEWSEALHFIYNSKK